MNTSNNDSLLSALFNLGSILFICAVDMFLLITSICLIGFCVKLYPSLNEYMRYTENVSATIISSRSDYDIFNDEVVYYATYQYDIEDNTYVKELETNYDFSKKIGVNTNIRYVTEEPANVTNGEWIKYQTSLFCVYMFILGMILIIRNKYYKLLDD